MEIYSINIYNCTITIQQRHISMFQINTFTVQSLDTIFLQCRQLNTRTSCIGSVPHSLFQNIS